MASAAAQPFLQLDQSRAGRAQRFCDFLTEAAIYFMVVFSPWAFGATEPWSIWTLNGVGFLLGLLLLVKHGLRWATGRPAARWGTVRPSKKGLPEFDESLALTAPAPFSRKRAKALLFVTRFAAVLTALALVYSFVSAANARATYRGWHLFTYHSGISWLPRSYDSNASWFWFWSAVGLACFFWATRDWLLEKTRAERMEGEQTGESVMGMFFPEQAGFGRRRDDVSALGLPSIEPSGSLAPAVPLGDIAKSRLAVPARPFPVRLRRLLWVLCLNASLLALEAILQRLDGTNKLLWLVQPRLNHNAEMQFGPYAYRANAAQYLNLVWPACLGFWLVLRNDSRDRTGKVPRIGAGKHLLLLPGAVLMAAGPIIATTRGGAIISLLEMLAATGILLFAFRRSDHLTRIGVLGLLAVMLAFSGILGWSQLSKNFETLLSDQMSRRPEIYEDAEKITRDFPLFGTGPGSFGAMYQMYRSTPSRVWAGYAHDDWLETRINFGWLGFALFLALLAAVLARWFLPGGGISVGASFPAMIWVALAGCLLHAKFDFPFQIYSIELVFLLLCAMAFSLARRSPA